MSTTAETTMTTNATRTMIDARLDAIDRALLGRLSRSERLDVVGEVESRIDELLRERCGPGVEPSREDVLAALARLDPPEAYLGDEPSQREAGERPAARVASPDIPSSTARTANGPAILGLAAAIGSIALPLGWGIAIAGNSMTGCLMLWGLAGVGMMFGGGLAVTLGLVERPRRPMTTVGLIAGAAAVGYGLAMAIMALVFVMTG